MQPAACDRGQLGSIWTINRVGLWVPCGSGNMGNEMTMSAIIQNLRRLHPAIVLYGFSWDPEDTFQRYGIPSFSAKGDGRCSRYSSGSPPEAKDKLLSSCKAWLNRDSTAYRAARYAATPLLEIASLNRIRQWLRSLDVLIFAGTGPFTDSWGGAMGFPYEIARWTHLCRIGGTKVAVASSGAGPLDAWIAKRLIRSALNRFTYRSFRDERSKGIIEDLGIRGDTHVYPDLVFSLPVPVALERASRENRKEVAIVGLPYQKPGWWEDPNSDIYERYVNSMADFTSWLLQAGYTVRLVTTHVRIDSAFINDLKSKLRSRRLNIFGGRLVAEPAESFEQIMAQLSKTRVVVASRFHGVVFSYLLGRPVLGISYHPKIRTLMKDFGQEEFCVDLPTLDVNELRKRFLLLERNETRCRNQIQKTVGVYRDSLEEQYQRLLYL